jgi:hypothetical protein
MVFKIILKNEHELLEEEAHLICGYFELGETDFSINLFKDRSCMVMLTLSEICDYLISNSQKSFNWIGVDNGKYYVLKRQKENLTISTKEFDVTFDLSIFKNALKKCLFTFISYCKNVNQDIVNQGGFIDLEISFNKL